MKTETEDWIEKAEGDWATMNREHQVEVNPNYDAVCFHAQQCAEKYLKGRLFEAGASFKKTHDLLNLGLMIFQKSKRLGQVWKRF